MIAAVNQDGGALEFGSESLRNNKEVVHEVHNNQPINDDDRFIQEVVQHAEAKGGCNFAFFSYKWTNVFSRNLGQSLRM